MYYKLVMTRVQMRENKKGKDKNLNSNIVVMNVILGHFDLEMISPQVNPFSNGTKVGPRRAFELGLKAGSRTPWHCGASVRITARTRR